MLCHIISPHIEGCRIIETSRCGHSVSESCRTLVDSCDSQTMSLQQYLVFYYSCYKLSSNVSGVHRDCTLLAGENKVLFCVKSDCVYHVAALLPYSSEVDVKFPGHPTSISH